MGFLRNWLFGPEFKRALVEAVLADAKASVAAEIDRLPAGEQAVAQAAIDLLIKRAVEKLA